jgi:hypothetical protein
MNEIRFGGMGDAEVIAGEGPWLSEADDAYDLGGILLGINELSENFWMM